MVSGYLPFQGNNNGEVFNKIKTGNFHFNHTEFDMISGNCKDLIKCMLVVNPSKRYNGLDCLKHKWFKNLESGDSADKGLSNDTIQRLQSYQGESLFKKACLNMLMKMATAEEVKEL